MTEEELERLKEEIRTLEARERVDKEKELLKKRLAKAKFRTKHKGLLKVTQGLEQGAKRIGNILGSGIKKTGKGLVKTAEALNKADEWVAKQEAKEKATSGKIKSQEESKPKKIKQEDSTIDDALNLID